MGVIRQVTLQRANRKSDKSISISFVTSLEESTEDFMEVDKLVNSSGILYYSEKGTLTKQETDEIDKVEIEVEGKTKSKGFDLFCMSTVSRKERTLKSSTPVKWTG